MNIALRKAALPISLLVAGACTVLYTEANAAQIAGKAATAARNTPLIVFVKKVIAAAPDEFAAFKGEENALVSKEHTAFNGILTPDADSKCTLRTRRGPNMKLQPVYYCHLGPARALGDAKAVYEKAAAELRAGFPNWKFEEKKAGDESKREESWTLSSEQPGFTVELDLTDLGLPGVYVSLKVTDTAPTKEAPKPADAQEN